MSTFFGVISEGHDDSDSFNGKRAIMGPWGYIWGIGAIGSLSLLFSYAAFNTKQAMAAEAGASIPTLDALGSQAVWGFVLVGAALMFTSITLARQQSRRY
jgi:hypothetical protein